jgi:hypothetical protein
MKLKIDTIVLEGIDKTGKDTIQQYIYRFYKGRYAVYNRGNISNAAYDKIFNRNEYIDRDLPTNFLYVLLTVEPHDLKIRFEMTNEPKLDNLDLHDKVFRDVFYKMTENHHRLEFDTTNTTAYNIAKEIINYCDKVNGL